MFLHSYILTKKMQDSWPPARKPHPWPHTITKQDH